MRVDKRVRGRGPLCPRCGLGTAIVRLQLGAVDCKICRRCAHEIVAQPAAWAVTAPAPWRVYDPTFGSDRLCRCGHPYYRHFDTYDEMAAVGCKYCECRRFRLPRPGFNLPKP